MSSPDSARSHIYQQHQKEVEARNKSDQGREHIYNDANIEKYEKRGYQIVVKYAYVSCVDTFDTKPELARHVDKMHLIQPPPMPRLAADNHWELDGNNISKKFHAYRQSCFDKSKTASFTMDGNFNELLSMSGVLVLQKRYNYQSFPVDSFPPDLLRSMHAHAIGSYSRCTFNPQILCQVMVIIQKYTDGQIDEEKAKIDLLNCARIAETNERAVINAVVALISNLYDCDVKTLSEAHLAASYIHPFIHDLLPSIGYIEVKPIKHVKNHKKINLDLHRLCTFSKAGAAKYNLKYMFQIMAVGTNVQFNISEAMDDILMVLELDCIRFPLSLDELPQLEPYLDQLYNAVEVIEVEAMPLVQKTTNIGEEQKRS
ncbi:hypothetical protein G6F60_012157 [Rhizopus arrhizus]|nr:hypothetical protein G6F60_012157 [Rhizopus arrhizus]